jgi:hypothetical protein
MAIYHCFAGVYCRHTPKRRQIFTYPRVVTREDLNVYQNPLRASDFAICLVFEINVCSALQSVFERKVTLVTDPWYIINNCSRIGHVGGPAPRALVYSPLPPKNLLFWFAFNVTGIYRVIKNSLSPDDYNTESYGNVQSFPRQSADIYWHAELRSRRPRLV